MAPGENTGILLPREAGKYISRNSQDVKIVAEGVERTANLIYETIKSGSVETDIKRWSRHALNPKTSDRAAVDWIFLSDVLNFSFWSEDESQKYCVQYNGQLWTGYWSLCAAIDRALDEGIPFTDPGFYREISKERLTEIFRSDSDYTMPMIEDRLEVLHEAGRVLCEKYQGSFVNVISECGQSAQRLLELVLVEFPSFRDVVQFKGKTVALYKRVQILIADIWACCQGEGYGLFHDIDSITMFADYRIPQALVWFGALEYSPDLLKILKNPDHRFESGDRQEVEIRGCSIAAVDQVVNRVQRMIEADQTLTIGLDMNAILIDHFLWDYRRDKAKQTQHIPIHRIRCRYY